MNKDFTFSPQHKPMTLLKDIVVFYFHLHSSSFPPRRKKRKREIKTNKQHKHHIFLQIKREKFSLYSAQGACLLSNMHELEIASFLPPQQEARLSCLQVPQEESHFSKYLLIIFLAFFLSFLGNSLNGSYRLLWNPTKYFTYISDAFFPWGKKVIIKIIKEKSFIETVCIWRVDYLHLMTS